MNVSRFYKPVSLFALLVLVLLTNAAFGDPPAPAAPATQPAEKAAADKKAAISVAVLDFDAKDPGNPDLGKQISETLGAILSDEPGFTLVERATLTRALQEQELNLTGLVDTDKATKIGKLVGAKIIVTGKAFMLGQKLFITAKLIGTETSLVEGVLVKGDGTAKVDELVVQLATDLAKRLRESGPKLIASDEAIDPLPALKAKLAGRKLPIVAVFVSEGHYGAMANHPIDPAAETEIKIMLRECNITVQDIAQNDLADWSRNIDKEDVNSWPRSLAGIDFLITGKAFSEFGARIGNLVSCAARSEINVINHKDGKIVLADRTTTRAVDLNENIAGKKALQAGGRELGLGILRYLADTLPPVEDKK